MTDEHSIRKLAKMQTIGELQNERLTNSEHLTLAMRQRRLDLLDLVADELQKALEHVKNMQANERKKHESTTSKRSTRRLPK